MSSEYTRPDTESERVASRSVAESPEVIVLLCSGLVMTVPEFDLNGIVRWLPQKEFRVRARTVTDLCNEPGSLKKGLRTEEALGLVLGLCGQDYPEVETQVHARRIGIDPLGIQVVNLASTYNETSPDDMTNARAKLVLGAAVERAKAFPGSQPENMKSVIPSSEKPISRRALFTLPPVTYASAPTINKDRCTAVDGCDLCVADCPYESLEKAGEVISVSRNRCQSCGVCLTVCPQRAIELPGWSAVELEAQVSYLLGTDSDLKTRHVAFVCKKATLPAGPEWLPVPVPCIAMVSVGVLLQTLAGGASATAILPCADGCPSGLSQVFRERIDYCRQFLGLLGGSSEAGRVSLLGNGDASLVSEIPKQVPPSADTSKKPIRLFGIGVAAEAVRTLCQHYATEDLTLEHSQSPLGMVEIDSETCTGCTTCAAGCPTSALSVDRQQGQVTLLFSHSTCVACGLCETLCPEKVAGAIELHYITDQRRLSQGPQVVFRGDVSLCERCGSPVATKRMVERIAALLGDDVNMRKIGGLCADCRGI
jgi:ferredoxin